MKEEWRPIPSCPGYDASNFGRIRRLCSPTSKMRGEALRDYPDTKGYRILTIGINGVGKSRLVHRLVCEAFHGPPLPGQCVNHLNGNKRDNTPKNLEWTSLKANNQHAWASGLRVPQGVKLTIEQVRIIRDSKTSSSYLGKQFGVSSSTVRCIRRRRTWRHV